MVSLVICLKVVACVFTADFLSGFFHWLEDAYGREDFPITGRLVTQPNIIHHRDPRYFTRNSWLYSARLLLVLGAVVVSIAWACGFLNWMTLLVVALGVNANEFHKWAHRSQAENGRLITFLQRMGLLQSAAHHARHHQAQKNTHYCVITNYLNPILDGVGFWLALEHLLVLMFGLRRRVDSIPPK
jgi:ubiquitin-conjugating enzyme E2 variant